MGFGIKKEAGSNTTPSEIVNFDKLTPTTVGVVFTPNTPATLDVLYLSSVDASTWIWNGTAYVTYTNTTASTEWYLFGTTIDAGSNKTAAISRDNSIYTVGYDSFFNNVRIGRGNNNIATNTVVGLGTGGAISTGSNNSFFGTNSGIFNSSGNFNSFFGTYAGYSTTTAGYNTFIGNSSGYSNTTGISNTFIGNNSGENNTTGSSNLISGFYAGRFIANGTTPLTIANQSVFLGSDTKALADNQTNQIVIGYNAIGKGSNTVNLGNTSITDSYINGIVHVSNTWVLPTVAPTSGQVLGYLGAGTTQWTTPSSSSGIWGIANSSGVYTYYATWALAVAAATSGQVIELFADITENAGALILKDGVNINGNGHTLTHNFANNGFTDNGVSVQCSINNLTLNKSNSPYYAVNINNGATNINGNAVFKGTQGIVICAGKINGFTIIGGYCLELNASTSVGSNLNVYCTTGTCVILTNGAKLNNSYINTISGTGTACVAVTSGDLNNSTVYANGNVGVTLTAGNVNNCSVLSTTSNAINSAAGTVINGGSFVSTGQTIGGISGYANNAYFRSTVNDGIGLAGNINNCVVISDLYSPVMSGGVFQMYNCEIISLTSRASNYGVTGITAGSYVVDSIFTISSISTAIHSAGTPTVYLSGNSVKGTTNFKSAGILNGQTNTADAQGNIILQ